MSVVAGFGLPFEGGRLLIRERTLWAPAVVPIGLSLCAFSLAVSLLFGFSSELYAWVTLWMPVLEAGAWYAWLWIGPAKLLLGIVGVLLFAVIVALSLVAAFLIANVLASPFLDMLAYRVELIVRGEVAEPESESWRETGAEMLRALLEELRRTAFFLAVTGLLAVIGLLIPGAQVVTGPAIVGFTIFFLPLDYASYALDRRRLSFRAKREWMMANRPSVFGFGVAAFVTCAIPLLNLLAMPMLVVGGTLLALRQMPTHQPTPPPPE